jgi:CBS domain containing-hemolysin-like protein
LGKPSYIALLLPVAFITITMLHIVFGELAPKSIAIQRAEQTTLAISIPLRFFYIIFSPFIWILNSTANLILRLIGFQAVGKDEELHSSDEIRLILEESTKSGAIGISEHELLENVFEFQDTPIKQIMVPRRKIQGVEIGLNLNDVVTKFISEGYSRMPVYETTIDNIIGIIYAKDLLNMLSNENLIIIEDIIRPPFFVQEDEKIKTLLHRMQKDKILMAIVIDEFGGTSGLVTM